MIPTDWADLWRDLASRDVQASDEGAAQMVERWRGVARKLDGGDTQDSDPLLDHVLARLTPEMTVLDVGAGIGRWALPITRRVRRVTAVEPLLGMRQVLVERATAQGVANLDVLDAPWLTAQVPPHDAVVAAHATYTTTDLLGFVRKMEACARRSCYLAFRVPAHDGIIGVFLAQVAADKIHVDPPTAECQIFYIRPLAGQGLIVDHALPAAAGEFLWGRGCERMAQ